MAQLVDAFRAVAVIEELAQGDTVAVDGIENLLLDIGSRTAAKLGDEFTQGALAAMLLIMGD